MPGRPVLAAVFSWRSLTRAYSRPLARDFQAWGPSSIDHANAAHAAEVIEPAGKNLGVDGALIECRIEAGRRKGQDLAGDGPHGSRRREAHGLRGPAAVQNHDAEIGPAAIGEIDGENGTHSRYGGVATEDNRPACAV